MADKCESTPPIKSEKIMIKLLAKIFIKNSTDYKNPDVRKKYGILCGGFGVFLNILLFTAKFIAGTISASIAMIADAFNNLSDAASSIISMLGFKLSAKKSRPGASFWPRTHGIYRGLHYLHAHFRNGL